MRTFLTAFCAAALTAVFLSGCIMAVDSPARGFLFTEVYGPVDAGG